MNKGLSIIYLVLLALFQTGNVSAGGLFGDILKSVEHAVVPPSDNVHKNIKEPNKIYNAVEEGNTDEINNYDEVKGDINIEPGPSKDELKGGVLKFSSVCITSIGSCKLEKKGLLGSSCYCILSDGAKLGIVQ